MSLRVPSKGFTPHPANSSWTVHYALTVQTIKAKRSSVWLTNIKFYSYDRKGYVIVCNDKFQSINRNVSIACYTPYRSFWVGGSTLLIKAQQLIGAQSRNVPQIWPYQFSIIWIYTFGWKGTSVCVILCQIWKPGGTINFDIGHRT